MIDVMIRKYTVYIYVAKHLVTELSIFWLGNGVEIKIFVHPINFFLNF